MGRAALSSTVEGGSDTEQPDTRPEKAADDFPDLTPYFAHLNEGLAAEQLAENNIDKALVAFDDIARGVKDPSLKLRAQFMAAYLAARTGDHNRALLELPALAEQLPLIADLIWETAALAALRSQKYGRAMDIAALIPSDSSSAPRAVLVKADALRGLGHLKAAIGAYESFGIRWPDHPRHDEIVCRAVACKSELAKNTQDAALALEGLAQVAQLRAQRPLGRWTRCAIQYEPVLYPVAKKPVPKSRREQPAALKTYDKAMDLMRRMKNREAGNAFGRAIRLSRRGGTLWCRSRLNQAIVIARQRDRERAANLFKTIARDCRAPDVRVRALYRAGKAFQSIAHHEASIAQFAMVESDFPTHSYADDARLHAAREYLALDKPKRFFAMLESLPDDYPQGDMRSEALWTLAHDALKKADLLRAEQVLERYYKIFPTERGWYTSGRSGYWLGRVQERLGRIEAAMRRYEQVISTAPFAFYMVMAYNRLVARDSERAAALMSHLAPQRVGSQMRLDQSLFAQCPKLEQAVELIRLGLTSRAKVAANQVLEEPYPPHGAHWAVSVILCRLGSFHEAKEAAFKGDPKWQHHYPVGPARPAWTVAYPPAYEDEVVSAATQNDLAQSLIWAVMREESGFNPRTESWANAIGLMQLVLPTAKYMGKRLNLRVTRKTLRDPKTNIALGSGYLSYLRDKVGDHPILMISGYNAGEGAALRWLKEELHADADMFVEEIPYDQTRGYTKRVIGTMAAYAFLYNPSQPMLEFPLQLKQSSANAGP